ncbi:MAG: EAL domain-containing protein [Halofilum sp. (in: g-proteobacteria)]|nr:EAL domain-containing protein [Halofilum sp. (in: g-proteobacteria)]
MPIDQGEERRDTPPDHDPTGLIVNSLPGLFYLFRAADGLMLRWNRRVERITGRHAEGVAGMHAHDFIAPRPHTAAGRSGPSAGHRAAEPHAPRARRAAALARCRRTIDSGYSSLAHLRDLPVDTLKIDRKFVHDLGHREQAASARAMLRSIIELGHNLGMEVLAEGIEQASQDETVRTLGCHSAQGFYYSAPVTAAAFEAWAARG